jgi:tetratricopeptide (TPR) repeat protein
MDSNDAALEARIAAEEEKTGHREEAAAALQNAITLNPRNKSLRHAYARVLIETGRFEDAYEAYGNMLRMYPRDADALINYGLLAARLNHPDEAVDSWERAVDADPNQPNAQLYLAEALDQRHEAAAAARHWEAFLRLASSKQASGNDPAVGVNQRITASIQLGDDMAGLSHGDVALPAYQSAILLAQQSGELRLESVALAHMADWQEKSGDAKSAAASYQHGLALDAKSNDSHGAALDWFNYGQFLRRRGLPAEISYACFLRAEGLLKQAGNAQELATVQTIRKQAEANLGAQAARAQKDLPALLSRAATLPPTSF